MSVCYSSPACCCSIFLTSKILKFPMDPLSPWICSMLALTTMPMHFKDCVLPVLPMLVPYSSPSWLMIRFSNFNNTKISHGHPLRPCLEACLPSRPLWTIFRVKRVPKRAYQFFLPMIVCCRSQSLLVMMIYSFKNINISCGRLVRHWLRSRFALTEMPATF